MVLKFESERDEIFLLDSTSSKGVGICRWTALREYVGKFYEQVVYRKLSVERDEDMIAKLEIFLKEAVGNSYGLSTSKLLFNRTTVKLKAG